MAKLAVFKLWGDYAHFKKFYTTTSPLTFEIPPPPTLIGMISAIIGLDKDQYLSYFMNPDHYYIAICLDKPIKKVRMSQNFINTKHHFWRIENRTQIRVEYLKDVSYRIYFYHSDSTLYQTLCRHLQNHESVYTVSLGLSELLANFQFLDEIEAEPKTSHEFVAIQSVIPYSCLMDSASIRFDTNQEILKVNYPIHMKPDRVVDHRQDLLFEKYANPIHCKVKSFYETDKGERIVFI